MLLPLRLRCTPFAGINKAADGKNALDSIQLSHPARADVFGTVLVNYPVAGFSLLATPLRALLAVLHRLAGGKLGGGGVLLRRYPGLR